MDLNRGVEDEGVVDTPIGDLHATMMVIMSSRSWMASEKSSGKAVADSSRPLKTVTVQMTKRFEACTGDPDVVGMPCHVIKGIYEVAVEYKNHMRKNREGAGMVAALPEAAL